MTMMYERLVANLCSTCSSISYKVLDIYNLLIEFKTFFFKCTNYIQVWQSF